MYRGLNLYDLTSTCFPLSQRLTHTLIASDSTAMAVDNEEIPSVLEDRRVSTMTAPGLAGEEDAAMLGRHAQQRRNISHAEYKQPSSATNKNSAVISP